MASKAILNFDSKVIPVANDVPGNSRYRAQPKSIAPEGGAVATRNVGSELLLFVEHGTVELMVEGAVGYLSAGEFARIPANKTYSYRNAGSVVAKVLTLPVRKANLAARTVTVTIAAA